MSSKKDDKQIVGMTEPWWPEKQSSVAKIPEYVFFSKEELEDAANPWFKITNPTETHNGVVYATNQVSTLTHHEKFEADSTRSSCPGRLYFTKLKFITGYFSYGPWIRVIFVPSNAQTVQDPDADKWGADRLLCGRRYSLLDPRTYALFGLDMKTNRYLIYWALRMGNIELLNFWKAHPQQFGPQEQIVLGIHLLAPSSIKWCSQMRHTHHFYFSCSSLTDKEIQVDQLNALLEFEFENKPRNMVDFLEKNDWSTTYDIWRTLVSKNQRKVMDWILDKKIPFSFGEHKASCVMDAIARSDTPLYFLNWFKSANMVLSLPSDLSTVSQNNRSVIRQWFKEHNCDPLLLQQEQACFELVQKAKERLEAETKTIMDSLHTQNWMVYGGLLCFGLLLCLPAATTKKSR